MSKANNNHLQWIEISQSALLHNLDSIKSKLSPMTQILAMVKANAYGHGITQVAPILKDKIDFFGVNTINEALEIRNLNINTPILITGPISGYDIETAIKYDITLCAHSIEYIDSIKKYPLKIHLKINTGMNRLGLKPEETSRAIEIIKNSQLDICGVYTHFHSSDNTTSLPTTNQLDVFKDVVHLLKTKFPNLVVHAANTGATLLYPQTHFDMVRVGIGMYGYHPSDHVRSNSNIQLKPVLSWYAKLVQSRTINPKETVGYSQMYSVNEPTNMGILPIGYSDGISIAGFGKMHVYQGKSEYLVIGRIAMNFIAIRLPNKLNPAITNQQFSIIDRTNSADKLASKTNSMCYETLARINPAIPRLVVE